MNGNSSVSDAAFVEELTRFHSLRGTTLKIPKFNRAPLDLEKLWHAVRKNGGSNKVCEMKYWAQIGRIFGGTTADKNVSNNIKRAFTKWLLPYERAFFPEEAMTNGGEHATTTTPRRKRSQPSTSGSNEKKPRSNGKKEEHLLEDTTPLVHGLSNVSSMTQASLPMTETPPAQNSTPELNGTASITHSQPMVIGVSTAEMPSAMDVSVSAPLSDQYTLSLLMHPNDRPSSDVHQLLPSLSVLFKPEATASSTGDHTDQQTESSVPRSGLLCLLDNGMQKMEDCPMMTPKNA